jgi:TrmH family RNA methyltransferase
MGALFDQAVVFTSHREFRRWTGRDALIAIGADAGQGVDYRRVSYRRPSLFMLGDERSGLSPGQRASCDAFVRIPMAREMDSINVAMAGTILMYEARNQRHPVARR